MKFNCRMLNTSQVKASRNPPWEPFVTRQQQAQAVRHADKLGYSKIGVAEHFGIPADHVELSGDHHVSCAPTLGWIAGMTETIQISSNITLIPLQHPLVHAKNWATLDWLSDGRAIMKVGVGWLEGEFDLLGVDFANRGRLCDEYIAAILELWKPGLASFEGKYVNFRDVGAAPKPVRPGGSPVWFGGDAPPVLRRLARWGEGWAPQATPPEKFPDLLDWVKSQPDYHGRPIQVECALGRLGIGAHHEVRNDPRIFGMTDPQMLIDQIGYLASLGVTETRLPPPELADFQAYLDWLSWVAEEIAPKVRSTKVQATA